MIDWQPIETAPRDGTRVLLYAKGRGVEISFWGTWGCTGHSEWVGMQEEPSHWAAINLPETGLPASSSSE